MNESCEKINSGEQQFKAGDTVVPQGSITVRGVDGKDVVVPWSRDNHATGEIIRIVPESRGNVIYVIFRWQTEGGVKKEGKAWVNKDDIM